MGAVSSHDFTAAVEPDCKDWARFQLLNAHDFHVTRNPWVDCFLGAGLAQHRAHHILPHQRSGFANHYSGQFIAQAAKEAGLPWFASKSLLTFLSASGRGQSSKWIVPATRHRS